MEWTQEQKQEFADLCVTRADDLWHAFDGALNKVSRQSELLEKVIFILNRVPSALNVQTTVPRR